MIVQRSTRILRALGFFLLIALAFWGSSPWAQAGTGFTGGGSQITFTVGGQTSQPTFSFPTTETGVSAATSAGSSPQVIGTGNGINLNDVSFTLTPLANNTSTTAADFQFSAQRSFSVTGSTGGTVTINGTIPTLQATGTGWSGSIIVSGFVQIPQITDDISPMLSPGQVAYVHQTFNFSVKSGQLLDSLGHSFVSLAWSSGTISPKFGATAALSAGTDMLVENTEITLKNFTGNDSLTIDPPNFNIGVSAVPLSATPEPASMTLAGLGVAPLAWMAWRRRRLRGA